MQYPNLIATYIRADYITKTYYSERHFDDNSISRIGRHLPMNPKSIELLKQEWPNAVVWLLNKLPENFKGNIKLANAK